jgi:hypothetical protein
VAFYLCASYSPSITAGPIPTKRGPDEAIASEMRGKKYVGKKYAYKNII